ncbi:MAG TPA: YceI family protein [Gemmatimonadaceae bacterium]|nr:YceI family protein [Gemmatimonadaceae bacterium]
MSTSATDTAGGVTTWTIDPAHSTVEFSVKHLMISSVKGRFGDVKGMVRLDEATPARSHVQIEIGIASVDTRAEQRDAHLRSADFFDAERFPTMTYTSKRIEGDARGKFKIIGDLTIRDVTREVPLEGEFEGRNRDPWGGERMAFVATGKVNRKEFGLNWNQALETGGWLVGDDIKLSIEVQLVLQKS